MGGSKSKSYSSATPIPRWAEGVSRQVLEEGAELGFSRDPFDVWTRGDEGEQRLFDAGIDYRAGDPRITGFDPLQLMAQAAAGNMYTRGDPYLEEATGLGRQAQQSIMGLQRLDPGYQARGFSANYDPRSFASGYGANQFTTQYDPQSFSSSYGPRSFQSDYGPTSFESSYGPRSFESDYGPTDFESSYGARSFESDYGPTSFESDYGPTEFESKYGASEFDFGNLRGGGGGALQDYMSPYMEGVVDREKMAASEVFEKQENRSDAERVASGARGGYREAIEQASSRGEQAQVMGDIEARGRQSAFENAQAQFERDRAAGIQAAQMGDMSSYRAAQEALRADTLGDESAFRASQEGLRAQTLGDESAFRAAQEGLRAETLGDESAFRASQEGVTLQKLADESAFRASQEGLRAETLGDESAFRGSEQEVMLQKLADESAFRAAQEGLRTQTLEDESAFRGSQQGVTLQQMEDQAAFRAAQEDLRTQTLGDESSFRAAQEGLRAAGMEDESAREFGRFRSQADMAEDASAVRQAQMRYQAQAQDMQNLIAQSQQFGSLGQFMNLLGGGAQDREIERIQGLSGAGEQRQDMDQARRDLEYERARSLYGTPFERINWIQGLLSGLPQQANAYTRSPSPSFLRQGLGAAAGLAGAQKLFGQ